MPDEPIDPKHRHTWQDRPPEVLLEAAWKVRQCGGCGRTELKQISIDGYPWRESREALAARQAVLDGLAESLRLDRQMDDAYRAHRPDLQGWAV